MADWAERMGGGGSAYAAEEPGENMTPADLAKEFRSAGGSLKEMAARMAGLHKKMGGGMYAGAPGALDDVREACAKVQASLEKEAEDLESLADDMEDATEDITGED